MKTRLIIPISLFIFTFFILLSLYFFPKRSAPKNDLPIFWEVTPFTLTDSDAQTFSTEDLRGKIWIVDFIFTNCPGICLTMSYNMSKLHQDLKQNDKIHFVSISVDPERDTPEILTKYADRYNADTDQWHFLTGDLEKIHTIAVDTFKLGSKEDPINHSSRFVLIDSEMKVRGFYDGLNEGEVSQLSNEIASLLRSGER